MKHSPIQSFAGAALLALFSLSLVACSHLVERSNAGISSLEADPGLLGAISPGAKYSGWAISAPLVASMTPVAALAWATPWIDLSEAVDIAAAPAIGLGYFSQCLVGLPAQGVLSLVRKARGSERAQPPELPATGRPFLLWGFVVEHLEAKRPARPAEEVPRAIQDYYGVSHEILGEVRGEFSRRVLE